MPGWRGRLSVHVLLFLTVTIGGAGQVLAQARLARASTGATASSLSASGTMTFGFARQADTSAEIDVASILPRGSELPAAARKLVEKVWRASPTFRRQCARLVEASVEIVVSLDFPRNDATANAETVVTRKPGLRAHIHLRGGDANGAEYLAHEIEHVLEQLDEVDLSLAVAERVHGAHQVDRRAAFETSRAIAVGRAVAREVWDSSDRDSSYRR
jgi:hypothetical protein